LTFPPKPFDSPTKNVAIKYTTITRPTWTMKRHYSPFFWFCRICLGTWSKNYWADRKKVWFFLSLIFWAVRNFKFQHMFCQNKKFCHVRSRFQNLDNIGSLQFISWPISMKLSGYCFSCPSIMSMWKIRHFWQAS
jgi:hypothetical protein